MNYEASMPKAAGAHGAIRGNATEITPAGAGNHSVSRRIELIGPAITRLEENLVELQEHLGFVLMPALPSSAQPASRGPDMASIECDAARHLYAQVLRIDNLGEMVRSIVTRLDV